VRSILPKLVVALHSLVINPHAQQLEPFQWFIQWASAVPVNHMVTMLEAHFFPKWQQVLYQWLCAGPNFDEVRGAAGFYAPVCSIVSQFLVYIGYPHLHAQGASFPLVAAGALPLAVRGA
jgi:hypothetical protein